MQKNKFASHIAADYDLKKVTGTASCMKTQDGPTTKQVMVVGKRIQANKIARKIDRAKSAREKCGEKSNQPGTIEHPDRSRVRKRRISQIMAKN